MNDTLKLVLSHPDNAEPITAEWLRSIHVYGGDREENGPNEHEVIFMATKNGEQGKDTVFLDSYAFETNAEVTVLGIDLDSMRPYIETWGQEVTIFPPVSTRLEFRLLLLSLKAWGYTGK